MVVAPLWYVMLCFPYNFLCPLYFCIILLAALMFVTRAEGLPKTTSLPSPDPAFGTILGLLLLQRSRIKWLKQGDKNTKFFHRVATSHKRYNSIESLMVDGCNTNDPSIIKETIKSFYQNLYTEPDEWRPELHLQGITNISMEEQKELEGPFEEEEILGCLKLCAMEKAPRLDGFPMSFYLSYCTERGYYKGYTGILC